jgi:hypothetical protein
MDKEDEDSKPKDAAKRTVARIGSQLPLWFRVAPQCNRWKKWLPTTVVQSGEMKANFMSSPLWFQVEWKDSVVADGVMPRSQYRSKRMNATGKWMKANTTLKGRSTNTVTMMGCNCCAEFHERNYVRIDGIMSWIPASTG